ncbi:hypothetical protein [Avibacterium paragallinarum]|uniref:Uncharacterized protein n=1 Tax=Avibacterium paragallinarum TaxID=728 RepID=A0A0F5ETY4_AVIPA|nr:hypothetical protein [Avibacterium paragallinarum]AZI13398.1 hypothetical protein EIA51_01315 [Avibacterium paragallinarum]KAA6208524.1 hypothetical protein F1968_08860 [Avibacterium paragallinarum]KKB02627.1 hypothetical protein Z012_00095 [Avibacterium paragallinarum]MEE3607759.1 hypothetical protein [Avibacterium paragallinarum]MEE3621997.1 hypothetical protein [Avibacterium paragallinarum]
MQQSHSSAIRAAGIGCALMLLLIAIALFTLPSSQIVDYLTLAGEWVGQGTTVGIFMLAALPSLTALLFYFIWKWLTK